MTVNELGELGQIDGIENQKALLEKQLKEKEEREAYMANKIPVEVVGFDISILDMIVILFKLNIAVAAIMIPFSLLILLIIGNLR